jgi:hypothetical protein
MIFKIAPGQFLVEDTCNPLVRPCASCVREGARCVPPQAAAAALLPSDAPERAASCIYAAAGVYPDLQDRQCRAVPGLQAVPRGLHERRRPGRRHHFRAWTLVTFVLLPGVCCYTYRGLVVLCVGTTVQWVCDLCSSLTFLRVSRGPEEEEAAA